MKKLLLLLSACVLSLALSAQINYYVETSGDDANDGLSELNALATVNAAFDLAKTSFNASEDNEYIINIGPGTFTVSMMSIGTCSNNAFSLTFHGAAADSTTVQGGAALYSGVKMFNNLTGNDSNKELDIYLEDMTLFNFSNGYTGGVINFNSAPANGATINATRCVFKDIKAAEGAIVRSNHAASANFLDCSFINIVTTKNGIFHFTRGQLSLENCFFDNCVRDYTGKADDNAIGTLIYSAPSYSWASTTFSLINNTIVNSSIINTTGLTTQDDDQKLIYFAKGANGTTNVALSNNLICGSSTDGTSLLYDVAVEAAYTKMVYTNCTNNIFNTNSEFPATGNTIDAGLTFTSPELDFMMDGTDLDYETTADGLVYATALGTSVVGGALALTQTTKDITGAVRSTPGCVGAVEYSVPGAKGAQTITFSDIAPMRFSLASAITLQEFASSGLPISYVSSDVAVASISGNVMTPVGIGRATITAKQAGDESFEVAPEVTRDIYLAPDTLNYYVRAGGAGTKDGLSESNAFASLALAGAAAVADGLSLGYIVNVDGTITNNSSVSISINRSDDVTFKIVGSGASSTTVQMVDDAAYATVLLSAGKSAGRVFASPRNSGAGNLTLIVEDLTFRNFGFTNDNGGALLNLNSSSVIVDVILERCNMIHGVARSGAIAQLTQPGLSLTLKDCFVSEMTSISKDVYHSPIRVQGGATFTAENCVFSKCVKSPMQYSTKTTASRVADPFGSVLSFTPSNANAALSFINNTVIGDSILFPGMQVAQSAMYVNSTVAGVEVTIANNLFIGGHAVTSGVAYHSINVLGTVPSFVNCTNNVMTSQSGFVTEGNDTEPSYSYDNAAINFTMDGDYPEIFTTAMGVSYVKANGPSVFQTGLSAAAPASDITGTPRSASPCVGAFEASEGVATTMKSLASEDAVKMYPNPVSEVLNIQGDVETLSIYNVTGRLVINAQVFNHQVDVSALAAGIYFVRTLKESGISSAAQRLVKK